MKLPSIATCSSVFVAVALLLTGCSSGQPPTSSFEVAAKGAQAAALSDDGKHSVIGSVHHGGSLWRNSDGERLFNWNHKGGEFSTITAADFSADGNWALTSAPNSLVLWEMKEGTAHRYWTAPGEVLSVSLTQDGNYALLGMADHRAVLFDVQRGGIKRSFSHENRVRSVALSNDGSIAITGSEDYSAAAWDVKTGKQLFRVQHDDDVQMVAVSGDGRLAMSAAKYDKALLWDTRNGQVLGEIPLAAEKLKRGLRFTSAAFSEDGRLLLTGRPDQIVQLWDTRNLRELGRWELPKRDAWKPTSAAVIAVSFSQRNRNYVAITSNGFVHKLNRE